MRACWGRLDTALLWRRAGFTGPQKRSGDMRRVPIRASRSHIAAVLYSHCRRRELPPVGGLEFIWLGVAMCLLAAFGGVGTFAYEILGFEVKTLIYAGVLFFLVYAMKKNLACTRDRLRDFAGPLVSVGLIGLWYLTSFAQDGTDGQRDLALLAIGLIGTKHAGDLMRHQWMAERYASFDLGFVLPAGSLLVVGLAGPGGEAMLMAPPNNNSFSVSVVLPASGWEIIAKVLRDSTSVFMLRRDLRL